MVLAHVFSWLFLEICCCMLLLCCLICRLKSMTGTVKRLVQIGAGVLVTVLAVWIFAMVNDRHSKFTCTGDTHIVTHGDTLWNIAIAECEGNLQNAVYHLRELNGGSNLRIGQKVLVPTGNTQ